MRKLQSILFATDFRSASRDAVPVAVRLAEKFGSHVTILHVMGSSETWPSLVHEYRDRMSAQMRELAETFREHDVLVDETAINVGHAADTIVRKAEEIDADLVLMGAGEPSRFERGFLGPVAAAVVQHASRPVLAIRPGQPAVNFSNILCPVDMSGTSARGLANAIQLARTFNGELIVLSVVPTSTWLSALAGAANVNDAVSTHEHEWRAEFDQFLTMGGLGDIPWRKEVRTGAPHDEIIASAKANNADIIVMGSTGRTGLARILLGSVTRRVLQQLPCSILTVKQQNVLEELHDDEIQTMSVLHAQGQALLNARSYDAALEKFSHVLLRNPFHVSALKGEAVALEALGRSADAARFRRRAAMIGKSDEHGV